MCFNEPTLPVISGPDLSYTGPVDVPSRFSVGGARPDGAASKPLMKQMPSHASMASAGAFGGGQGGGGRPSSFPSLARGSSKTGATASQTGSGLQDDDDDGHEDDEGEGTGENQESDDKSPGNPFPGENGDPSGSGSIVSLQDPLGLTPGPAYPQDVPFPQGPSYPMGPCSPAPPPASAAPEPASLGVWCLFGLLSAGAIRRSFR